jgi:hypothetical protein
MPEAHQESSEFARTSSIGSAGSSRTAGNRREIHNWIATFSVNGWPSMTSVGTLCLGFSRRYSAARFSPLRKLSGRTSNSAPASVSVTYGTSAQVIGA